MSQSSPFKYINSLTYSPRQRVLEDIIIEAIKKNGLWIKYIPKEVVNQDRLFGDDPHNRYEKAIQMEVYLKNIESFGGQGDMLTRMGFMISDTVTFTIAVRRWEQLRSPKLVQENDYNYQLESAPLTMPYGSHSIDLEEGDVTEYDLPYDMPRPGDLIWFPMVSKLFEITHVEHEDLFYQFGKLMTYDMQCELHKYNSDEFDTGNPFIDQVEELYNTDLAREELLFEDDTPIDLEDDDGKLVSDDYEIDKYDRTADNDFIQKKAEDIIDYSEKSPLVNKDKW